MYSRLGERGRRIREEMFGGRQGDDEACEEEEGNERGDMKRAWTHNHRDAETNGDKWEERQVNNGITLRVVS